MTEAAADDFAGQGTLDLVVNQVYGTADQRTAAAERSWLLSQTAIATGALTKGAVYGVTKFQPMDNPGPVAPGDLLAFAPQRADFGVGTRIQTLAKQGEPVNPGLAVLTSDDARDKWFQAVTACQNAPSATDLLAVPEGQEALESKLVSALSETQQDAAPDLPSKYAACMTNAGVQAKDLSEAYQAAEAAYPQVSYEKPSDVTGCARGTACTGAA